MSLQRLAIPAAAGTAALGAIVYFRSKPQKSRQEQIRQRAEAKKDQGLTGAGVGTNAMTGGHEVGQPGSGVESPSNDAERRTGTTAPKENLPSGGVGGGPGAGNSNARAIDLNAKKPGGGGSGNSSSGGGSSTSATGEGQSVSQAFTGLFGQGGKATQEPGQTQKMYSDTRIASNHAETPTKKHT